MRHEMTVLAVAVVAAAGVASAEDGPAVSVRPGLLLSTAQVGYTNGNLFVGGGLKSTSESLSHGYESTRKPWRNSGRESRSEAGSAAEAGAGVGNGDDRHVVGTGAERKK